MDCRDCRNCRNCNLYGLYSVGVGTEKDAGILIMDFRPSITTHGEQGGHLAAR